jgi:hypothetical protein
LGFSDSSNSSDSVGRVEYLLVVVCVVMEYSVIFVIFGVKISSVLFTPACVETDAARDVFFVCDTLGAS